VADALAAGSGIVVEGRDIGTVVLPDADVKVFLTADEAARASRRALEEAVRAGHPNPAQAADEAAAEVAELLAARDALDSGRAVSPLKPASDAVVLDASLLTLEDVVAHVVALVRERVGHV
jgi:cytidylate kinase